jgi:hypothetical protein
LPEEAGTLKKEEFPPIFYHVSEWYMGKVPWWYSATLFGYSYEALRLGFIFSPSLRVITQRQNFGLKYRLLLEVGALDLY